jgi:gliding motility-associated protein GldC
MSDEIKKKTKIEINVGLDENHVPVNIDWHSSDGNEKGKSNAFLLALWDKKEENAVHIDLWNKEMSVYDMQRFFHQNLLTMAETYERATGQEKVAKSMREYAREFAEQTEILG